MATEVSHRDMDDGTVTATYDDGSQERWWIDHPEWGSTKTGPTQTSQAAAARSDGGDDPYGLKAFAGQLSGTSEENQAKQLAQQKYAVDQQYKAAMANAKNDAERNKIQKWWNERQVELALLTHSLNQARLGLDYLKQGVEYAQTPDNYFKLLDFQAGAQQRQDVPMFLDALLRNQQLPAWQQSGGMPTAKSLGDMLQVLGFSGGAKTGQGLPSYDVGQNITATGATAPPSGEAPAPYAPTSSSGGAKSQTKGAAVDPRLAGAQAIMKASPPSALAGYSAQDAAALEAIMRLYSSPQSIQPGDWESQPLTARKLTLAGVARGGGDPALFLDRLARSRPNLGSALQA